MAKTRNRASIQDALMLVTGNNAESERKATEPLPVESPSVRSKQPDKKRASSPLPSVPVVSIPEVPSSQTVAAEVGRSGPQKPMEDRSGGHRKTSTGYIRANGEQLVRLTLHLTPGQKRTLQVRALEAGFDNPTAFIIHSMDLG